MRHRLRGITTVGTGIAGDMTKDRDQLTPAETEDRQKIHPKRSADREATSPGDPSTGPGPASSGHDPKGADEVGGDQAGNYR